MADDFEKEFEFSLDNQNKLVKKYAGKVIVIKKSCKLLGVYDSEIEAFEETCKEHPTGTFIVQQC